MIRPVCLNCGEFKDEHSYGLLRCRVAGSSLWHPTHFYEPAGPPEMPGWIRSTFDRRSSGVARYKHRLTRTVVVILIKQFESRRDPKQFLEKYLEKFLTPRA